MRRTRTVLDPIEDQLPRPGWPGMRLHPHPNPAWPHYEISAFPGAGSAAPEDFPGTNDATPAYGRALRNAGVVDTTTDASRHHQFFDPALDPTPEKATHCPAAAAPSRGGDGREN